MRIIVDINHPAHVHFFRNFVWEMRNKGHDVQIVASNKDIALKLLKLYKLDYINIGSYGKSLFEKLINFIILDLKMIFIVLKYNPDVIMGIATIRGSHAGWLLRKKVLVFTDTEHAKEQIALYKPFATKILTPECFTTDLGSKQIRYKGYHELAYLHPNRFTPDKEVLKEMGIKDNDRYFIIRLVSWDATHDIGQKGLSYEGKKRLFELLEKHGRIIITSESKLPDEFTKYQMKVEPTRIFDLMYYADLYIGEGATMASESAILGTPTIYISTLVLGYLREQENKYGVQFNITDEEKIFPIVEEILNTNDYKKRFMERSINMVNDRIDVTSFMIDTVTNINNL